MKSSRLNILSVLILFLVSCGMLPQAKTTQTSPATRVPLAATIQATSTELPLTKTTSPKLTIEPVWTLPATLSVDDSFLKVNELLKTNAGCHLPCWWGITPGQSKWEDARNILFPLAEEIGDNGQSKNGEFLVGLMTRFGVDDGFEQDYTLREGIVQAIKIKLPYTIPGPNPKDIFTKYGIPDEVYVGGEYFPEVQNWQSFWIYLYYTKQRIFVEYDQGREPIQLPEKPLSICFSKIDYAELHVWGPEYLFDQSSDFIAQKHRNSFQSLEKVTNLTITEFYKLFTSPTKKPCFETPAQNWMP